MEAVKSIGGSMGLSCPMLSRTNYTARSMKMRIIMQTHGVWDSVEPTDPKISVEERADKIALSMIYQNIPEEMLLSLAG